MLQDVDSGLQCVSILSKFHRVSCSTTELKHQFSKNEEDFSHNEILHSFKYLSLKAKLANLNKVSLDKVPLPAIFQFEDGEYFILAGIKDGKGLIQKANGSHPELMDLNEIKNQIQDKCIVVTKRAGLLTSDFKFGISWFIPYILKYKKLLLEVVAASFFIQILSLASPIFFQVTVDKVLVHRSLSTLDVLIFGMIAVSVFEVILSFLRTYLFSHTTNRIDVVLGSKLYQHLMSLPLGYFNTRRVGQTVARVRELDSIRNFITSSSLTLIIDLFFTIVFFSVMYYYSPKLTAIVLASIPVYVALAFFVTPVLRSMLENKFKYGAENQAFLVESISGAETIKASAIEPQMRNDWNDKLAAYVKSSFKVEQLSNFSSQVTSFVNKITMVLILYFGATEVISGAMTVGMLIAFNMLANRVNAPILKLSQLWNDFQQAGISIKKLADILDAKPEKGHDPNKIALSKIRGDIDFKGISFRYAPNRDLVIKNFDLSVRSGEVIGIVGRSGSGKSTLTKLIQRLYVPESGRVLVDGVDISTVNPSWLRRQVGVVLQDNFLFSKTIKENIALAHPAASIDQVIQCAKMAGAHEFISTLPDGYDTIIEEQGSNLSGGQKQRIAIARALMGNPKILIFDEATSALDYESERIIQDNMKIIARGRTVFVIAHRLSAIAEANRILVMEKGSVVETGDHKALISRRNGLYKHLWDQQLRA